MIIRAPRQADNFTILPNEILRDQRLSFRARGIAAFCLSQPPGFRINSEDLAAKADEGREAVRKGLKELENAGYLRRDRSQQANGRFVTESYLYDSPTSKKPSSVPPAETQENPGQTEDGLPGVGNLGAKRLSTREEELNKYSSPLFSSEEPQVARDENDFANPMETAFEEIWKNYPRKMAKPSAFKAWRATVRRGAEVAELAQAVGAYADECVRERREPKFIKHGSTFFGPNEPWRDYVATISQPESVASSRLSWQERILAKAKTKSFEDEIAYLITAPDLWLTKDEFEGMVEHLGSEAIDQIEREVEEAARG